MSQQVPSVSPPTYEQSVRDLDTQLVREVSSDSEMCNLMAGMGISRENEEVCQYFYQSSFISTRRNFRQKNIAGYLDRKFHTWLILVKVLVALCKNLVET